MFRQTRVLTGVCGDALGSLKNEADDHLKDCGWAKDDIKRLREEEGGMLHFDALILGGCKFYCLPKKGCEDIAKLKGFKKSKGEELAFRTHVLELLPKQYPGSFPTMSATSTFFATQPPPHHAGKVRRETLLTLQLTAYEQLPFLFLHFGNMCCSLVRY